MTSSLVLRVAARFLKADQPPGARQDARKRALPVNKPRGIDRQIQRDNAKSHTEGEDAVEPNRRDIVPKDVFPPSPKNTGVLNLVETGRDLSKALEKQVPKDEGYDNVRSLSQYLIRPPNFGVQ